MGFTFIRHHTCVAIAAADGIVAMRANQMETLIALRPPRQPRRRAQCLSTKSTPSGLIYHQSLVIRDVSRDSRRVEGPVADLLPALGGGLWMPESRALALLRRDIDRKPQKIKRVLTDAGLRKEFFSGVVDDEKKAVRAFVSQSSENALKRKPKVS